MKRSPLRRKTPLAQGAPLKRTPMKRTASKRRQAKAANDERFRSPEYLSWVRTLPCVVCGTTQGVIAHHMIGMWGVSGMGLKAPDSLVMPACDPIYGHTRDCHQQIHANKALRDQQPDYVRATIRAALTEFTGESAFELVNALAFLEAKEEGA